MTKPTKWHVRPAKTQISLGIRPLCWSESSLSAWRKLGSLATLWSHRDDSDQIGQMPRLIWVFAGRTCHFVGFVTMRLNCGGYFHKTNIVVKQVVDLHRPVRFFHLNVGNFYSDYSAMYRDFFDWHVFCQSRLNRMMQMEEFDRSMRRAPTVYDNAKQWAVIVMSTDNLWHNDFWWWNKENTTFAANVR